MSFLMRRRFGEKPVWMGEPVEGGLFFSMLLSPDEYEAVELKGHATLDGVKAHLVPEASSRESGFARFALEQPYKRP